MRLQFLFSVSAFLLLAIAGFAIAKPNVTVNSPGPSATKLAFDSGSTESLGSLTLPPPAGPLPSYVTLIGSTYTLDLSAGDYDAARWVVKLNFTNVWIKSGATLKFKNHSSRAAVAILAKGTIIIDGILDASGASGNDGIFTYTEPGPGGFRGGKGNINLAGSCSAGFGPGQGQLSLAPCGNGVGGGGSHAVLGHLAECENPQLGTTYGGPQVFPLIGGSGGAGENYPNSTTPNGGAGGGAVLMAANISIAINNQILAMGGHTNWGGPGSGGAFRLISPIVTGGSGAIIGVYGGSANAGWYGSMGRIRIETDGQSGQLFNGTFQGTFSLGHTLGPVFQDISTSPAVRVSKIATTVIPPGFDPLASYTIGTVDTAIPQAGPVDVEIEVKNVSTTALSMAKLRVTFTKGAYVQYSNPVLVSGNDQLWTAKFTNVNFANGVSSVQCRVQLQ